MCFYYEEKDAENVAREIDAQGLFSSIDWCPEPFTHESDDGREAALVLNCWKFLRLDLV